MAGTLPDGDSELARRFAELVQEHQPALERKAMTLCGGHASNARDLVQDTFERAWKSLAGLRPEGNVRGWLFTILQHRFIDLCRRGQVERSDEFVDPEILPAPEAAPASAWDGISTEEFRAAVARLGGDFRLVYQLHAFEGKSYDEIATVAGIDKSTVGTRLLRARRKLRDLLQPLLSRAEPGGER